MAVVILISRLDNPQIIKEIAVTKKIVLGNSIYCDVVLEDKTVASMQCEILQVKSGHIIAKNLDLKKEVLLNQTRLKKSSLTSTDILKIGPYLLSIDNEKLTPEELAVINTEYEEFV